jgi:hypothetical protein
MAFDVSALAAYIENRDFPLVAKMQFDPELKAGRATLQDGIKKSSNLHFMDTDVVFQTDNCTRSASDTTSFTDKTITVGKIAIAEDLCLDDLEGKWTQILLRKGVREGREVMPDEIAGIYFDEKMVKYKQALAVADWRGDTLSGNAQTDKYDGWIKIIDAGSPVVGNTTLATAVNVGNILAVLDAMYLARPTALRGRTDVCIDMPQEWYDLYVVALKNANLFHFTSSEGETKLYGTNVNIKGDYGLNGTNRMFLSYDENYVIGLDSETDGEFTSRLDPVTNKKILVDANFRRGTQVQFIDLVVEFTLVP